MGRFSEYPYKNFSELNLDYVFKKLSEMDERLSDYVKQSTISFHDPITWDITDQYTVNTMVIDSDGTAYLSVKPVPVGIDITDTDYWQPIFNYDDNINSLRSTIAANERGSRTASAARSVGDLVYLNDKIYKVTVSMNAGDAYIIGTNCVQYTVSDRIRDVLLMIDSERNERELADTALSARIDNEISARESADTALGVRIDNEISARESADTALGVRIDDEEEIRENAVTALGERIDDETSARIQSDNEIRSLINTSSPAFDDVIMIGDSYSVIGEYPAWPELISRYMNIERYYLGGMGGAGFATTFGGPTFLSLISSLSSRIPEPNDIKHVVIAGGINDAVNVNTTNIKNAMNAFNSYVRSTYPNAKIHLAFMGYQTSNSSDQYKRKATEIRDVIQTYIEMCGVLDWHYLTNSEYTMRNVTLMNSDGLHPNSQGEEAIAKQLVIGLRGGACDVHYRFIPAQSYTTPEGVSIEPSDYKPIAYMSIDNDATNIVLQTGNFVFNPPIAQGVQQWINKELLSFTGLCPINTDRGLTVSFPCNGMYNIADVSGQNGFFDEGIVKIECVNGKLYLTTSRVLNAARTAFNNGVIRNVEIGFGTCSVDTLDV